MKNIILYKKNIPNKFKQIIIVTFLPFMYTFIFKIYSQPLELIMSWIPCIILHKNMKVNLPVILNASCIPISFIPVYPVI